MQSASRNPVSTSSKTCDVRAEKGLKGGLPASSSDEASSMPKSSSSSEPTSDRGALRQGNGKYVSLARLLAAHAWFEEASDQVCDVLYIKPATDHTFCSRFNIWELRLRVHNAVWINKPFVLAFANALSTVAHAKI